MEQLNSYKEWLLSNFQLNFELFVQKASEIKSFIFENIKLADVTLRNNGFGWPLDNIAIVAGIAIFIGASITSRNMNY